MDNGAKSNPLRGDLNAATGGDEGIRDQGRH